MSERLIELERSDAARAALLKGAEMLEGYATNELYAKALKLGAAMLRTMATNEFTQTLNDDGEKITDTSGSSR